MAPESLVGGNKGGDIPTAPILVVLKELACAPKRLTKGHGSKRNGRSRNRKTQEGRAPVCNTVANPTLTLEVHETDDRRVKHLRLKRWAMTVSGPRGYSRCGRKRPRDIRSSVRRLLQRCKDGGFKETGDRSVRNV
jgi:hypothetical protein